MTTKKINVAQLDFDQIKALLKTHMEGQAEFSDYDFDGAGLSILLDVLAYNSHLMAATANLQYNEAFLDSAVTRSAVNSISKHLNYLPASRTAASAVITVSVLGSDAGVTSVVVPAYTKFTTSIDGTSYTFQTLEDTTIAKDAVPVSGTASYTGNLTIYEGSRTTYKYTIDTGNPTQRFVVPSNKVDISTLTVTEGSTLKSRATDILELTANSDIYFLQPYRDGEYEVVLGNGILGVSPVNSSVLSLKYLITSGKDANGASVFSLSGAIVDSGDYPTVTGIHSTPTLVSKAAGGAERQTVDSIKFLAPRAFSSQNRAVTVEDYKTILQANYSDIETINVWGGEDAIPQQFGKVFISIKPISANTLTTNQKNTIKTNILNKYGMISIRHEFVDPEYTYIRPTIKVKFNKSLTSLSAAQIVSAVTSHASSWADTNLEKFGTYFKHSKFVGSIDDLYTAIQSNDTSLLLAKRFVPVTGTSGTATIRFEAPIEASSLTSNTHTDTNGYTTYFDDDGAGVLRTYRLVGNTKTYINTNAGTVNYTTGLVTISDYNFASLSGDGYVELVVEPTDNDITPKRNQILLFDDNNTTVTATEV